MLESVHQNPDVYGAIDKVITQEVVIMTPTNELVSKPLEYSPLFLKMVDEILVNATDQKVRRPKQVKNIEVTWDADSGEISVYNDGPTISPVMHTIHNVYNPQLVFCEFLTSSNFRRTNKTTGGKNGIGAKLANAYSSSFVIECSDKATATYYYQEVSNCMAVIGEPTLWPWRDCDEGFRHEFTRVTFIPDWKRIGYAVMTDAHKAAIECLIYMRVLYASIFIGMPIMFNGVALSTTLVEFMKKYSSYSEIVKSVSASSIDGSSSGASTAVEPPPCELIEFTLKDKRLDDKLIAEADIPTHKPIDIDVVVYISPEAGFKQLLLVNSIYCMKGGTLVKWVFDALFPDKNREALKKKYKWNVWNRKMIDRHMVIGIRAPVENPRFGGQAKEELEEPTHFKGWHISDRVIASVQKAVIATLDIVNLVKSSADDEKKTKVVKVAKKYERATRSGTAERHKCALFIPEGDSASNFISRGLTSVLGGFKYYGIFNMGGKPMNVRKQITIKQLGGRTIIQKTKSLIEYERWDSFIKVLGLNYSHTYDNSVEGNAQFAKLAYGRVIAAVDQDDDGVGHIFGLILNFFHVFFPKLIERGFVQRMATPILKAFPRNSGKTLMFYSDAEYRRWAKEVGAAASSYKVEYFKGLAGHDKEGTIAIFKRFGDHLYTYAIDNGDDGGVGNSGVGNSGVTGSKCDVVFECMFGKDADLRKVEFSTPVVEYEVGPANVIGCSQQLLCETKQFFLATIVRNLPHVADGLRPSARMVLAGARQKFKTNNDAVKVYQLGGRITEQMHYHHGDQSLSDTIIRMAQRFPGAKNFPYLFGKSDFGSRRTGIDKHGAARYISANLTRQLTDILFPHVDDFLLPYRYDEGVQCEPEYYVPILPMVILESYATTSAGWKCEIYARNFEQVVANVKALIDGVALPYPVMESWFPYINCERREDPAKNKIFVTGDVAFDEDANMVYITDLPYGVWPNTFLEKIVDDPAVDYIENESSDVIVDIKIKLKAGYHEKVMAAGIAKNPYDVDYITSYFKVYAHFSNLVNIVNVDGSVMQCDGDYVAPLLRWFALRKDLYAKRVDRRAIQLRYLINMTQNVVRYADSYSSYSLNGKKADMANAILVKEGYVRFNKTHINNPAYVEIERLEEFFNEDASYNYLLGMTDIQRLEDANLARKKELKVLEDELAELIRHDPQFKGARIWRKEIDEVCDVIRRGMATDWTFGHVDKY